VITKALTDLDGGTIAFYRGLFAGLALLPIVKPRAWQFRAGMLPLIVAFGAMSGLFIGAIKNTTAANAIFLQYSSAVWSVPLSLLILRERPNRRSLYGIAVAASGIVLIVALGGGGGPNDPLGIMLGLGSGVAYASVAVGLRGLRGFDAIWLSAVNNLGGACVLGLWLWATTGPVAIPDPRQTVILIAFGVIQMAIPYILFARGLREIPAPEAGLISLIEPILNPIWVILFIGEYPEWPTWFGGAFLLVGVGIRYAPLGRRRPVAPQAAEAPSDPASPG